MSEWAIKDNRLVKSGGKDNVELSAEEIYAAVFEENFSGNIDKKDAEEINRFVKISKYPAALNIVLSRENAGSVCASLQASNSQKKSIEINYSGHPSDHIIIDGTWHPLQKAVLERLSGVLHDLSVDGDGELSIGQYLKLQHLAREEGLPINDTTAEDVIEPESFIKDTKSCPEGLQAKLYPYQNNGWNWLRFLLKEDLGGILADEMGLGKTMQIIALLVSEPREKVLPSLIVAPSTLLENWRREIDKFAPSLTPVVHQGQHRTGNPRVMKEYEIVISSYDTVVRDSSLFGQIDWNVVVLDEAQAIKNPETQRAIWIKKLKRRTGIAVTGTPVENRLRDLWSIMDFAVPNHLDGLDKFINRFESDVDGARDLEPLVSPLILRRTVSEVAKDLPPRIDIPQWLDMPEQEYEQYEAIRADILAEYENNATLQILMRLRMFCTHPFLVSDETGDPATVSRKYARLLEILEEIFQNDSKVIVFTSYNRMIDTLVTDIAARFGVYTNFINGDVPVAERQGIVDEFSAIEGGALLALNPRAAGTGLNITAANHVIHYNLEWNPAIEDQASARAHRRGQDRPVTIHRLIYSGTVEEGIDDRLQRKRTLAGDAVVGVEGKEEEIQDILNCLNISPGNERKEK